MASYAAMWLSTTYCHRLSRWCTRTTGRPVPGESRAGGIAFFFFRRILASPHPSVTDCHGGVPGHWTHACSCESRAEWGYAHSSYWGDGGWWDKKRQTFTCTTEESHTSCCTCQKKDHQAHMGPQGTKRYAFPFEATLLRPRDCVTAASGKYRTHTDKLHTPPKSTHLHFC